MESDEDKIIDPNLKKQTSYTYWVDPKIFNQKPVDCAPKKIDPNELPQNSNNTNTGHSAWNALGTWEEKKIDINVARDVVTQELENLNTLDGRLQGKLEKFTGEVHFVLVRGKKKLGYHLELEIEFVDKKKEWDASKIKFNAFADDGEREYSIRDENEGQPARKLIQNSYGFICDAIIEALEKLKELI